MSVVQKKKISRTADESQKSGWSSNSQAGVDPLTAPSGTSFETIGQLAERRRIENRIAQRNYRKKLKRRIEDVENELIHMKNVRALNELEDPPLENALDRALQPDIDFWVPTALPCTACIARRVYCDGVKPVCSACSSRCSQCEYAEPRSSLQAPKAESDNGDYMSQHQALSCTSCENTSSICDKARPICSSCLKAGSLKLCRYRSASNRRSGYPMPISSAVQSSNIGARSSHPSVVELEPGILMIDGQISVFEPSQEHEMRMSSSDIMTEASPPSPNPGLKELSLSYVGDVEPEQEQSVKRRSVTTWVNHQHGLNIQAKAEDSSKTLVADVELGLDAQVEEKPETGIVNKSIVGHESHGVSQRGGFEALSEYASTVEPEDHDKIMAIPSHLVNTPTYEFSMSSRVSTPILNVVHSPKSPEADIRKSETSTPMLRDAKNNKRRMLSPVGMELEFRTGTARSDASSPKLITAQSRYVRTPDDVESPYDQMRRLSIKAAELITQPAQRKSPNSGRAASSSSSLRNQYGDLNNGLMIEQTPRDSSTRGPEELKFENMNKDWNEILDMKSKFYSDRDSSALLLSPNHKPIETEEEELSDSDPLKHQNEDLPLDDTGVALGSSAMKVLPSLQDIDKEVFLKEESPDLRLANSGSLQDDSGVLLDDFKLEPAHLLPYHDNTNWKDLQTQLPESWMWDVNYHSTSSPINTQSRGCWTCTPLADDDPKSFPLTIAGSPVVLPVEYTWPPMAGVNPPPDPRPSAPVDCTAEVPIEVIRDLFLTFDGSLGFYLLVNGVLQIIVSEEFDKEWASSHLPHKYGGLKVCYIVQNMEPTMVPSKTNTMKSKSSQTSGQSSISGLGSSSSFFRPSSNKVSTGLLPPSLQLNDFIEARTKSSHRKEKFAGRIGARVTKDGEPYLVMSSHVVTEAILAKSHRATMFGRSKGRFEKLDGDWNEHVEIWAGNEKIGTIDKSFDPEAEIYPNGFMHDTMLVKPSDAAAVKDIHSPIPDLGWLSRESWNGLRQQSSSVKILGSTEIHRAAKTLKTNRRSEVLVVGEGIFRNQTTSKATKDHDVSTWEDLVSRALLYRVYPDFDPPNGYSGIGLYADGLREDGTTGPGMVGFQSFVQRSGHVQSFDMEGGALEQRLRHGRVAFYGAFQVPDALRREYILM